MRCRYGNRIARGPNSGLDPFHARDRCDFLDGRPVLLVYVGENLATDADQSANDCFGNGLLVGGPYSVGRSCRQDRIEREVLDNHSRGAGWPKKLRESFRQVSGQMAQCQVHRGITKGAPSGQVLIIGEGEFASLARPIVTIAVGKTQ